VLADFIGLDTCLAIMEVLHDGFGDPRYRPCPLLRQYVDAAGSARRPAAGVYRYDAEVKKVTASVPQGLRTAIYRAPDIAKRESLVRESARQAAVL